MKYFVCYEKYIYSYLLYIGWCHHVLIFYRLLHSLLFQKKVYFAMKS